MVAVLAASDDRRSRDRLEVARAAVLRLGDRVEPIVLEDLTAGGCRFACAAVLPLFAEVSIGIAGIGHTRARLVWQGGASYGCAFDHPLPPHAVTAAAPDNVARIARSVPAWQIAAEAGDVAAEVALLPLRARVAIIAGLTAGLWCGIGGLIWRAL